ncbi:hypothetical protein BDZ89DRAFT_277106 [Hymenopellis radicata]|nr:hypothetical protein BDZ89DRAFT_277106 [Hymenopellis radicata]
MRILVAMVIMPLTMVGCMEEAEVMRGRRHPEPGVNSTESQQMGRRVGPFCARTLQDIVHNFKPTSLVVQSITSIRSISGRAEYHPA